MNLTPRTKKLFAIFSVIVLMFCMAILYESGRL